MAYLRSSFFYTSAPFKILKKIYSIDFFSQFGIIILRIYEKS